MKLRKKMATAFVAVSALSVTAAISVSAVERDIYWWYWWIFLR